MPFFFFSLKGIADTVDSGEEVGGWVGGLRGVEG